MIGVLGSLSVLMSLAQALPLPPTENVILSLSRHYGRAVFSECRLDVVVYGSRGNASLWCDSTSVDSKGRPIIPDLNADEELTSDETKHLTATLSSARLFDGGHIGTDGRAGDGIFETLKLLNGGKTVVLVTSGNPTFDIQGPRKQLLSMLNDIEKRLREKARR